MILRKGMRVFVSNGYLVPTHSYVISLVNKDSVFIEGWWDATSQQPASIPHGWLWPILETGQRVSVSLPADADCSPVLKSHIRHPGIWTVKQTLMYGEFLCSLGRDAFPCAVEMLEIPDVLFDSRLLNDVVSARLDCKALKTANTSPGAKFCVSCGGPLKDPGMGPAYKHCPKCEP